MELLFILYNLLVHLLNCKAVNTHPKQIMSKFLENIRFFLERLKGCTQSVAWLKSIHS